ncbi:MAG TPA: hypothetical protein VHM19_16770, partial [Polyangiales bacterium]|nr:hypothetical protein [Polyangiales bacterium]
MLRPGIAAVCIVALSACGFPSLNVSDEDAGAHDAQVGDASTDAAGFDAATNSATADAGTDAACDAARDAGCEAPAEPCRPGDMELCYSEPVSISLNPPC